MRTTRNGGTASASSAGGVGLFAFIFIVLELITWVWCSIQQITTTHDSVFGLLQGGTIIPTHMTAQQLLAFLQGSMDKDNKIAYTVAFVTQIIFLSALMPGSPIHNQGLRKIVVVVFFGGSVPLVALTQLAGMGITGFVGAAVVAALLAVSGPELVKRLLHGDRFPGFDWQRLSLALSYASDEQYVVDADLVDEPQPDEGQVQEDGDELRATKPGQQQKGQEGPWVPAQFALDSVLDIVLAFNQRSDVYFGDSESGAIAIPLNAMYHVIDVSSSGKGKSNRFRLAMMQMVNHCETYYINPLAANVKPVTDSREVEVWKPIYDRLANKRPIKEGSEIKEMMTSLVEEIKQRNDQEDHQDFSWQNRPIFVFIDELPEVFDRCPDALKMLDKIGRMGRQFCVFCWVASQTANVNDIGLSTAAQAQFKK